MTMESLRSVVLTLLLANVAVGQWNRYYMMVLREPSSQSSNGPTMCAKGFRPDDLGGCIDDDECRKNPLILCGPNADCVNTFRSFTCVCRTGYIMNHHRRCVDLDECKQRVDLCTLNEDCLNEVGKYACYCKAGFARSAYEGCVKIGKHHEAPHHPHPPHYDPYATTQGYYATTQGYYATTQGYHATTPGHYATTPGYYATTRPATDPPTTTPPANVTV